MITGLELKNFKAFKETGMVNLGQTTLVSGKNSSGKSSLYQSLLLLTQSKDSRVVWHGLSVPSLRINGDLLTIGNREELLKDPSDKSVSFRLIWNNGEEELFLKYKLHEYSPAEGAAKCKDFLLDKLHYIQESGPEVLISLGEAEPKWEVSAKLALGFDYPPLGSSFQAFLEALNPKKGSWELLNGEVAFSEVEDITFSGFSLEEIVLRAEDIKECANPSVRGTFDVESFKRVYKKRVPAGFKSFTLRSNLGEGAISRLLSGGIVEIPPFRGVPQRIYNESHQPNPLHDYFLLKGAKVPYRFDFDAKKPIFGTLKEALNFWVSKKFDLAEAVHVEEVVSDYATQILLEVNGRKIPVNNMGFGVSQVLPVIFRILSDRKQRLLIVDEPEIHLHPGAQAILADFFLEMALVGKHVFVETHSETLLNRLILSLAKYPEHKHLLKMFWVEADHKKDSVVTEIEYDDMGYILNQPNGFLDEVSSIGEEFSKLRVAKLTAK